VASGSWDATVKLWGFKRARSAASGLRAVGGGGGSAGSAAAGGAALPFVGLMATPLTEIFDHTSPVLSVAFGPGADLVASGADDGRVVVSAVAGLGVGGEGDEGQGEAICVVELSELGGSQRAPATNKSGGSSSGGSSNGGFDGPHAALALAWGSGGSGGGSGSGGSSRRRSSSAGGLQLFAASRDGMVRELAVPGGYCRVAVQFPGLSASSLAVPRSLAVSGALIAAAGSGCGGRVAVWAWPAASSAAAPHLFDTTSNSSSSSSEEGTDGSDDVVSLALHADSQLLVAAAGANLRLWTINDDTVPSPL